MRNMIVLTLFIHFSFVKVYGKAFEHFNISFTSNSMSYEEIEEMKAIHDEVIEEYNKDKEKIHLLRINIQDEMRKESPNWDRIKILNIEKKRLQSKIEKKISEFWENKKYLQLKNEKKENYMQVKKI